jgi:integrase/recombinase XerD
MRDPANLPALLQSFFTIRLMTQRKVSTHTIASYRDTFRLLLRFCVDAGIKRQHFRRSCG